MNLKVIICVFLFVLLLAGGEGRKKTNRKKDPCVRKFRTGKMASEEFCKLHDQFPKLIRRYAYLKKAVEKNNCSPLNANFEDAKERWTGPVIKCRPENRKSSKSCPHQYEKYKNGLYEYKNCGRCETWEKAREICQEDGGDLLTIETDEEFDFFLNLELPSIAGCPFKGLPWLGATDKEKEGRWVWPNRQLLSKTDKHWIKGQPDNYADKEDCVHIKCNSGSCGLNDMPCGTKLNFICQRYI